MQETTFLNANDQYDPRGPLPRPPVWELQGQGTVTHGAGPAQPPHDLPPPWFNVRLTFADGAWIDVLAVVDGERLAIEDLRADPPLPLESFAALAGRIEDPLGHACGVTAQQPPDRPVSSTEQFPGSGGAQQLRWAPPEWAAASADAPRSDGPMVAPGGGAVPADLPVADFGAVGAPRRDDGAAGAHGWDSALPDSVPATPVADIGAAGPSRWAPVPAAAPGSGDPHAGAPSSVRRRARPAMPRGRGGRRIAADAYRAAQQDGRDPVLAVMGATGRSRRKALRLIAGARDEGYLPPRRNRRRSDPAQAPVTSSASG
ncbi:DUF6214 family protein [Streptomyces sp. CA-135486]|uniref:DUF6214 family protein n=1 Tax=Streptomyces sp. CA-135486 TaxID=3240049 RepID=UPI003D9376B5